MRAIEERDGHACYNVSYQHVANGKRRMLIALDNLAGDAMTHDELAHDDLASDGVAEPVPEKTARIGRRARSAR